MGEVSLKKVCDNYEMERKVGMIQAIKRVFVYGDATKTHLNIVGMLVELGIRPDEYRHWNKSAREVFCEVVEPFLADEQTHEAKLSCNEGLVAAFGNKAIRCCIDIYMDYHVSEIKKMPKSTRLAWELGQKVREYKIEGY